MGFDFDRVIGENKELVKCPICFDVVDDAVQVVCCQKYFCSKCMDEWLSRSGNPNIGNCPFDRSRITRRKIVAVPRIVNQLLEALTIKCQYMKNGCQTVCKLSEITAHESICDYGSGILKNCDCGVWMALKDISDHKCIRFLGQKLEFQDKKIVELQKEIRRMKSRSPALRNRATKVSKSAEEVSTPNRRSNSS